MKILLVGGSGHIGSAVSRALQGRGHGVVTASRNSFIRVDVLDPTSIARMFQDVGTVDAVIATVGAVPFKPLAELAHDDFLAGFRGKALAQIDLVQLGTAQVADGGSFTLTSGILTREPVVTGAVSSMANGALEAFATAAATELPRGIRINVVSPTVLVEATGYHSSFPGFAQVPAAVVAQAYVKSVENRHTGQIYSVG